MHLLIELILAEVQLESTQCLLITVDPVQTFQQYVAHQNMYQAVRMITW